MRVFIKLEEKNSADDLCHLLVQSVTRGLEDSTRCELERPVVVDRFILLLDPACIPAAAAAGGRWVD